MATKLLVVGGGKMGSALVAGLLRSGWAAGQVVVVEASPARRAELASDNGGLAARFPGLAIVGELVPADDAVVAVKPADVEGICRRLGAIGVKRVVSVAAGVKLADLARWCGPHTRVLRAMPNIAAVVGEAATAVAVGAGAGPEDLDWASAVMGSVGSVVEVHEALMDAVTGLSGSGPAYVSLVAEAMVEAGVLVGLSRELATQLVNQTLLGSARLLVETKRAPSALRAEVTSPGGTTAAGLRKLEERAVRSAFIEAVAAAVERSRELGA
jgi:pyrroline-5-carboxylate reductase